MTRTTAAQLVSGNVVHLDGFAQPAAVIDARHEGGWTYVDVRPEGCYFPVMRRMTSGTPVTVIDPQLEALSALIAELSY